jgi:predicted O-methyltransferase YrrM
MKKEIGSFIRKIPILRELMLFALRVKNTLPYQIRPLGLLIKHWFVSREVDNFTYNLTQNNLYQLISFIAAATKASPADIEKYVNEILNDTTLTKHIDTILADSRYARFRTDTPIRFGRRIGWYTFVRALKPKVVVETGVHSGIGSCVLTAALLKNKTEGYEGTYYGTDIDPNAGFLLQAPYNQMGKILYGDSIESLTKLDAQVDLFINDSDHSAEYEYREYETILSKLSEKAVILGDNSHGTDKLFLFARKYGWQFLFFREQPLNHWYVGAGIGCAFR